MVSYGAAAFPPYIFADKDTGECVGDSISQLRAILLELDYSLTALCVPAPRLYKLIGEGHFDLVINIKSTPSLANHVTFVGKPYRMLTVNLYEKNAGLHKPVVAAVRSYGYSGMRQKLMALGYEFSDFPNAKASVDFFLLGRARHLLVYEGPFRYIVRDYSLPSEQEFTVKMTTQIGTYIGVYKGSKHYSQLTHQLQAYSDNSLSEHLYADPWNNTRP